MDDCMLFTAHHPVTLRWTGKTGDEVSRRGRLHRISQVGLSVMLPRPIGRDDSPRIGDPVSAEAGEYSGRHLTVFRGSVQSIESRLVRIQVDGGIDVVQRRRFPRAKLGLFFASAVRMRFNKPKFFVAQPVDISGGGVRIKHRLQLVANDKFRLILRLDSKTTVIPTARVVDTWEVKEPQASRNKVYISRAQFVEVNERERHQISRYVFAVLQARR
jgi:hypothetical protein